MSLASCSGHVTVSDERRVGGRDEHHCKARLMKTFHRVIRFSKREHGMPKKFEFSDNHIPYTYTKNDLLSIWKSNITGHPVFHPATLFSCKTIFVLSWWSPLPSSPLMGKFQSHTGSVSASSVIILTRECGVYSWPHDHLIWFVGLYYAALYYSVWHGKDYRI